MKRFTRFWGAHWRLLTITGIIVIAVGFLLLYRLGPLTSGIGSHEALGLQSSSSIHTLLKNPLFLPVQGVQWLLLKLLPHHQATALRLASVLFGILTLAAFAYILRRWYGLKTALYGSTLFVCSAWYLHTSRYGSTDILYLWALPTLLALQILWERQSKALLVQLVTVVGLAALLYIPGVVWFLILTICLQPQLVVTGWRQVNGLVRRSLLIGLFVLLLVPLVWGIAKTPLLLQTWLGLPKHFDQPLHIVKRLGLSISYLFYRGPLLPEQWLDRQPILGIFELVSAVLGVIFYLRHFTAPRTRQLLGLFIIGIIFFALQGPVSYSIVVPIIYLVITAGIGYLLHEWLHVFPRNPLARSLGYGLLCLVIVLACAYNVRSYFVAWPHSTATQAAFRRS